MLKQVDPNLPIEIEFAGSGPLPHITEYQTEHGFCWRYAPSPDEPGENLVTALRMASEVATEQARSSGKTYVMASATQPSPAVELVTDVAHHRLAVFECWRRPCCHSIVGARRPRIPARPYEAVAATQGKAQFNILCPFGLLVSALAEASSSRLKSSSGRDWSRHRRGRCSPDWRHRAADRAGPGF
jgi:hypothetical protein